MQTSGNPVMFTPTTTAGGREHPTTSTTVVSRVSPITPTTVTTPLGSTDKPTPTSSGPQSPSTDHTDMPSDGMLHNNIIIDYQILNEVTMP